MEAGSCWKILSNCLLRLSLYIDNGRPFSIYMNHKNGGRQLLADHVKVFVLIQAILGFLLRKKK